jgi:hypothetical protein
MEEITTYLTEQGSLDVLNANSSLIVEDICLETDDKGMESNTDTGATFAV